MGNKPSAGRKREKTRVSIREKRYDPNDVTLNVVNAEDAMDFLCADYASPRATMSCGHAVTPMSLTAWCRRQLDEGGYNFVCGQTYCGVEWPFEEVQKMALLTPEEIEEFDQKMFQNAAIFLDIKCCPGCSSRVARTDPFDQNVVCKVCTSKRGRTFAFCWRCLGEWRGATRSGDCGNEDCQDPLEILQSCPDITFENVHGVTGCPSTRACPTCGFLVGHNRTKCKNIVCFRCKVTFCFVCLKLPSECAYQDESYYARCSSGVAPRQTVIPVWKLI
ncbi:potential E3 ubiquitin-protein ligase ariadne-2-like [Pungitius pungitius]|uniref:potential E3 ubiquitin-protein ligase ariadne-2-like n=1 Tax=Pungitius pungitius TaxID=134920 RepID=UPI002E0E207D